MTARARQMSWGITLVGLLLGGGTILFLSRAQAVNGLSGQDIAQIRKRVRSEVWGDALPKWSLANARDLPRRLWRTCKTRVEPPTQWQNISGQPTQINGQFSFTPADTWMVFTSDGRAFLLQKVKGSWQINGRG
jgi:hypothetical protein